MDLIESLKQVGFTQQEALMYVTLLKHGDMTGYEAAKQSGISRSNAYAALSSLVEKGGALITGETGNRFMAVPKDELVMNLRRKAEETLDFLQKALPDEVEPDVPYITVTGFRNALDKMRNCIALVKSHIYLSMCDGLLGLVQEDIRACAERGIKTVVISDSDPGIEGVIHYRKPKEPGFVKVIADTSELLTGIVSKDSESQCLYSKNRHLVQLMREAFLNEILLIKAEGGNEQ